MGLAARVVHDLFQMIGAHGADIGDVADDRHFALEYAQCHFHALGDIRHVEHASGHERARHDAAGPPAGVEPRGDGHARFKQVPGKQEEQGAVARKDDRGVLVGGERAAGAQQDVGPARAHDAGQRPAGEGDGPFHAAGGHDDVRGGQLFGLAVHGARNPVRLKPPDGGAGVVGRAGFAEAFHEPEPGGAFLGIEQRLRHRGFDIAEKLAARGRLLVDEGHVQPAGARGAGGGESGGAGSDDDEIHVSVHYSASPGS